MAFSEVREYQYGDDIRNIDWNVTARFNHPYIKIFEEERELTVMLLIDVSGSNEYGSEKLFKEDQMTEMISPHGSKTLKPLLVDRSLHHAKYLSRLSSNLGTVDH